MDRDKLRQDLIKHEGCVLKPYQDSVGVWTVGVGHNLESNAITFDAAMVILEHDIDAVIVDLNRVFPIWRNQSKLRQEVLVNMCFNLGIGRLGGFVRMWDAIAIGDYKEAARQMLDSKWASQVGYRAKDLANAMERG